MAQGRRDGWSDNQTDRQWWFYYCTTSFKKDWIQVLHRFKLCTQRVRDLQCWGSLTMIPAGKKLKYLSSVNRTTRTIHGFRDSVPVFKMHGCYYYIQQSRAIFHSNPSHTRQLRCVNVNSLLEKVSQHVFTVLPSQIVW